MNLIKQSIEYLGDSVYIGYDGYHIWLYTDNGYGPINKIALEPAVIEQFENYRKKLKNSGNGDY